jgi:Holliday junction resolvasome RuvABC endonuclease subunit
LIPVWLIPGSALFAAVALKVHGYAYGTISTSKQEPAACRLEQIYTKISQVLADEKPDFMVLEDVFSLEKYPKSGIVLGKVCGVVLLAGTQVRCPLDGNAGASGQADTHRQRQRLQGTIGAGGAKHALCPDRPSGPFMHLMHWDWL